MRPPTTSKKQVALRFSATTSSEDNDFREEQELFLHITNGATSHVQTTAGLDDRVDKVYFTVSTIV